jgi:hypothetical protein
LLYSNGTSVVGAVVVAPSVVVAVVDDDACDDKKFGPVFLVVLLLLLLCELAEAEEETEFDVEEKVRVEDVELKSLKAFSRSARSIAAKSMIGSLPRYRMTLGCLDSDTQVPNPNPNFYFFFEI